MSAADGYGYQLVTVPTGNQHETDKTYQQICQGTGAIARTSPSFPGISPTPARSTSRAACSHTTRNNMVSRPQLGALPLVRCSKELTMHRGFPSVWEGGSWRRMGGGSLWRLRSISRGRTTRSSLHSCSCASCPWDSAHAPNVHCCQLRPCASQPTELPLVFPVSVRAIQKQSVLVFRGSSFAQCRLASVRVPATSQYMLTPSHLYP